MRLASARAVGQDEESKGPEHNLLMLAEYWRNKGEEMESTPRSLRNSNSSLVPTSEDGRRDLLLCDALGCLAFTPVGVTSLLCGGP